MCLCCKKNRPIIYKGPIYTENDEELNYMICPWCIADGSAHKEFGVEFID